MKLEKLTECSAELGKTEITGITCDSREVKPGYVFVCINGAKSDGYNFAADAKKAGAAVIVAERDTGVEPQNTCGVCRYVR